MDMSKEMPWIRVACFPWGGSCNEATCCCIFWNHLCLAAVVAFCRIHSRISETSIVLKWSRSGKETSSAIVRKRCAGSCNASVVEEVVTPFLNYDWERVFCSVRDIVLKWSRSGNGSRGNFAHCFGDPSGVEALRRRERRCPDDLSADYQERGETGVVLTQCAKRLLRDNRQR